LGKREIVRSFICIDLPSDIKRSIYGFVSEAKKLDSSVKWVEEQNLHLTLKFLGEEPVTKVDKIRNLLSKMIPNLKLSSFRLTLKGFGVFPDWNRPRVIWLGIEGEGVGQLKILRDFIEAEARKLDFVKDSKSFSPHITLGRAKSGKISSMLRAYLEERNDMFLGEFMVGDVILMKSHLLPRGPVYTPIAIFPLKGGQE